MKKTIGFIYAILCYAVGLGVLVGWMAFVGNLIPGLSLDGPAKTAFLPALLINIGLVALFAIQHEIMARKPFKAWLTRYIPKSLERSTFVLFAGITLGTFVLLWQPLGGPALWNIGPDSTAYYVLYAIQFTGWGIVVASSFMINHFDLFGLRQAYFGLIGKPYEPLRFRIVGLYKAVRHPLYFGFFLGIWSTPYMSITHLVMALLFSTFLVIGMYYEEKDLVREHGEKYLAYRRSTPKIIPFLKPRRQETPVLKY